jgi:2-haloacid dehalogenase
VALAPVATNLLAGMTSEMIDFSHYRALSFDCYGTLIDWESGILNWARDWRERTNSAISPAAFLEGFAIHERAVQGEQPSLRYPLLLGEVARRICASNGIKISDEDAESFGQSVGDWPAFPDSTEALRALAERFKLVILSNVDRSSFARSNERLAVKFDVILTAEDVGAYKPSTENFDALLATIDGMGIAKHALLHVGESMYHDIEPANRDQIDVVWINRNAERMNPRASGVGASRSGTPLATYGSMKEFAEAALLS